MGGEDMIRAFSKLRRWGRAAGLHVIVTIAAIGLTVGGCGLSDGTGFGDEPDCGPPPKGVQTIDENTKLPLCEGESPDPPSAPSVAESNEIISKIEGFGRKPGIEMDRFGWAMMSVCASLAGDASPAEIAPHAAKWFGRGDDNLSVAQSRSIVDLIETQGWCVM